MSSSIMEKTEKFLTQDHRQQLKEVKLRQVSAASTLSSASSTSEFVDLKIDHVSLTLEYLTKLRSGLNEAWKDGMLSDAEYHQLTEQIETDNQPCKKEIVVLKRQKKILIEDLDDQIRPSREKLEDAYASITDKVMSAAAKQKEKKFNQSQFRQKVLEYYQASKTIQDIEHAWCHLLGMWIDARDVKAAHIVPKSLQSEETSYLFGVGEAVLSIPKNALSLQRNVEQAMDSGAIVLVPVIQDDDIQWKCVVTDKNLLRVMLLPRIYYKDVDDKKLSILGLNRPARRYLYFRFVITYLNCKRTGTMEWVSQVEAKGHMWASPGPYLRQSLLLSLARKVSDLFLPEAFYKNTTFSEADGNRRRPEEEEEELAMSLAVRVIEEGEMAQHRKRAKEEEEEEEEEGKKSEDGEEAD